MELDIDKMVKTTIIVAYGPNEDEKAKVKDAFWEQLSQTTEEVNGRLIILGDLNVRVGRKDEETGETIGLHGERVRNTNE
ncbi:hypothetical protein QE152_g37605 [Popillia japonica]|uniref:Craniofacial development protein 2-like n=1 Tax=Popillia japonica TaxID=7064 RepID=A0AAW1I977_POPJA